jgi:hypothetical protein
MNAILKKIIDARKGNYCHVIEVGSPYEIECIIDTIANDFSDQPIEVIKDFFNTMQIIFFDSYDDDDQINEGCTDEDDVYNFDINSYIDSIY